MFIVAVDIRSFSFFYCSCFCLPYYLLVFLEIPSKESLSLATLSVVSAVIILETC